MEFDAKELNLQIHNLPAAVMMECQLPEKIINDLNKFLDVYKKDKNRKNSPLVTPKGASIIDNSNSFNLTIKQLNKIFKKIN